MYTYSAKLIRVIDGDSVWLEVDLGFRMSLRDNFRLLGINTPELRSQDPEIKERAYKAKDELERLLSSGDITIKTEKAGKYGRWLVNIIVTPTDSSEQIDVNQYLLNEC